MIYIAEYEGYENNEHKLEISSILRNVELNIGMRSNEHQKFKMIGTNY